MDLTFLSHLNYLGIAAAGVLSYFFGSLWFGFLFREPWKHEVQKHLANKQLMQESMGKKMAFTFAMNLLTAFAVGCLVALTHASTLYDGLILALIIGLGIILTTFACTFIWEERSLRLFLIDVGYPLSTVLISALLLSAWHGWL